MTYEELMAQGMADGARETVQEMRRLGLPCSRSSARLVVFGTSDLEGITTGAWLDNAWRLPEPLRPSMEEFLDSRTDSNDVLDDDWD